MVLTFWILKIYHLQHEQIPRSINKNSKNGVYISWFEIFFSGFYCRILRKTSVRIQPQNHKTKQFGSVPLSPGDKIGIVGGNGKGK